MSVGTTKRAAADPFAPRRRGVAAVLLLLLAGAGALSLGVGEVVVPPAEVLGVVAQKMGLSIGTDPSFQAEAVVWQIRLPRVLLGAVAGAAFSVGGAVLQGVLRNRLAEPYLLGIGPGAALGGVIGAVTGGIEGAIAGGTVGGVLTGLIVRRLSAASGAEPSRFVLTGVALGAAITAWVGFAVFVSDSTRVPPIEFWLLGSLVGSTWRTVGTTALISGLGVVGLFGAARTLDLFTLGEADARHLGVDVDMATAVLLTTVGAVTGAAVGAVGVVVFVGLLVPHLVRRLVGPAHKPLLVGSALGGALFVVLADLGARTIAAPAEIPVGLLTAAVGGPFFLWLIRRPEIPQP